MKGKEEEEGEELPFSLFEFNLEFELKMLFLREKRKKREKNTQKEEGQEKHEFRLSFPPHNS